MNPYTIPKITAPFDVELSLPGSKSIALRQLAISALAEGSSTVRGVPACDDTDAMLECLAALGVQVEALGSGDYALQGPMARDGDVVLDARMSGASTRLLIGLAALRSGKTHIDGHPSLQVRTNRPLYDVLQTLGCQVDAPTDGLPVTIQGPLRMPGAFTIDGSLSSQYITALLVAAPAAGLSTPVRIDISGELVSRPYLDITCNEMAKRGIRAQWVGQNALQIEAGDYSAGTVSVEGDATAASYFLGLATLHASRIRLTNLGTSTCQGDYAFTNIMQRMGATVEASADATSLTGPARLNALDPTDMTAMPDAALTLITMAPLIPGDTVITGLQSLHHKECDRLECPARELRAWGIDTQTRNDAITVPATATSTATHTLTTYHDHRMAMAFSLPGSAQDLGVLTVDDERVVDKTYPAYWQDFERLTRPVR